MLTSRKHVTLDPKGSDDRQFGLIKVKLIQFAIISFVYRHGRWDEMGMLAHL